MNFSPDLSTNQAILMSLTAAFMWGTWFISLKYLVDYPLDGFYVTLFSTSLLLVWSVGIALDGTALFGNLQSVLQADPSRVWLTILCGILYVLGMRISLYVYSVIGLSLSQPIQASVNVLAGTAIAAWVGGIPQGLTISRLIISLICLTGAIIASMLAGRWQVQSQPESGQPGGGLKFTARDLWRGLGLLAFASLFLPAYTFGISYGLRSTTHPQGLAVMPFMTMLATGAFLGSMLSSGVLLVINKQWKIVLKTPFSIARFGIISGLFHYGGNIIHTFATAFLSSAVSWPLGVTAGLWTQLWGLAYGEFRSAPKKAYAALISGILLYLLGAYFIVGR